MKHMCGKESHAHEKVNKAFFIQISRCSWQVEDMHCKMLTTNWMEFIAEQTELSLVKWYSEEISMHLLIKLLYNWISDYERKSR